MISGLGISSSGIAAAVRTAGKARATMDTLGRQIATGQRVSSAKDDGAAWTRAAELKSERVTWSFRHDALKAFGAKADLSLAHIEEGDSIQREAQLVLAQAAQFAPGSSDRARLNVQWEELRARADAVRELYLAAAQQGSPAIQVEHNGVPGQWVLDAFGPDSFLDEVVVREAWWLGQGTIGIATPGYTTTVAAVESNFLTATQAQMAAAATELLTSTAAGIARTQGAVAMIGGELNTIDRARDVAAKRMDGIDTAIGSLTDADLGRASAARAQAESRQQLALSTVRQALDAYGAYAGGLLGNVQRTQRGISA
jgi:flagellin